MVTSNNTIPVVDLQDLPPNELPKLIAACEEWGCFRLLNFQQFLPATLMSEMKTVARSLIDLPVDIKRRPNVDVISGSGYRDPSARNPLYEALGLYDMSCRADVETFCSQLDASIHQREIIVTYAEAVHKLFVAVVEKLAEGLSVKSEIFGFEKWPCQFRINKYHFTPESVGSHGVHTHTDSGFLTVLQDDECVGGLEVMAKSGEFIAVDPWPGTLFVNLGDVATVWSNGRFRTVKHRVQCKEARVRVSIASFLLGPRETLEPLPELVDNDHPCVYVPTTFEEYRKLRMSTNLHAGEALELLYTSNSEK
uniref:2-oxoglutarate-dependent dioxygenase DAO-like n=1 Tax=Erigeron canadensis TaxID=72917 RepID=UPI001CB9C4E4|nr:2-oxoglutarate-dependent dioxygenase DAO-like [Erigeron canadensis]